MHPIKCGVSGSFKGLRIPFNQDENQKLVVYTSRQRELRQCFTRLVLLRRSHILCSVEKWNLLHTCSALQHQLQQGSLQAKFCLTLEIVKKALSYSL